MNGNQLINLADLHCDTMDRCFREDKDLFDTDLHICSESLACFGHVFQCFAHFLPEKQKSKWQYLNDFLDHSLNILNRGGFEVFQSSDDLAGKRLAILTLENADIFESSQDIGPRVATLSKRNVKIASLIYNHTNRLGSGALSKERFGLTPLGAEAMEAFESEGVIIDISHASSKACDEILARAKRPVCATHSNAYSLCAHPRNLSDSQLRQIAECGGLVGVNFYPPFLSLQNADISAIMQQIKYILNICGSDHISFGCDFDGVDALPEGIVGLESMERIYELFEKYGFSYKTVDKLYFENVFNFLKSNFRR